jgi:hypothetical protein
MNIVSHKILSSSFFLPPRFILLLSYPSMTRYLLSTIPARYLFANQSDTAPTFRVVLLSNAYHDYNGNGIS